MKYIVRNIYELCNTLLYVHYVQKLLLDVNAIPARYVAAIIKV